MKERVESISILSSIRFPHVRRQHLPPRSTDVVRGNIGQHITIPHQVKEDPTENKEQNIRHTLITFFKKNAAMMIIQYFPRFFLSMLLCLFSAEASLRFRSAIFIRGGSTSLQLPSKADNSTISANSNPTYPTAQPTSTQTKSTESKLTERIEKRKKNLLDYEVLSLALRLAIELNRRLYLGTRTTDSLRNEEISIFYTPPLKRTDLMPYLRKLYHTFRYENDPYVVAITLVYLDRACSLETFRPVDPYQGDQSPSCPHLSAANVHKLYLAANILALRTYRNELPAMLGRGAFNDDITRHYLRMIHNSGDETLKTVSEFELGNLLEWMVGSLGSEGLAVQVEEVDNFIENWKDLFD